MATTRALKGVGFLLAMIVALSSSLVAQDNSASSRKVLKQVPPQYPGLARTMRLAGSVKAEAVVGPNGTVKSVEIKGGNPVLAESAKSAILQWTWDSSRKETHELVEIKFTLQ